MTKKNILILGAGGKIARLAIDLLLKKKDYHLTLYLLTAKRLSKIHGSNVCVIEGDVLNFKKLKEGMEGNPRLAIRKSLGVYKPNTDADKPSFIN